MRRVFWAALGATVGVLVVRKMSRTAQAYSPESLGRSLGKVADALSEAADAVREGMAEREAELRSALGVGVDEIDRDEAAALLERPAAPRHRG